MKKGKDDWARTNNCCRKIISTHSDIIKLVKNAPLEIKKYIGRMFLLGPKRESP
jgi:hypothetical protein